MKVGVYIDGYNLYYGGRGLCGRSTPGWRWLDLKALVSDLVAIQPRWQDPVIETVTQYTARVSGSSDPIGQREQDIYLRSLERYGSATRISYGHCVAGGATAPLATAGRNGKPVISRPKWPLMVQDGAEQDVNVASLLLIDALT